MGKHRTIYSLYKTNVKTCSMIRRGRSMTSSSAIMMVRLNLLWLIQRAEQPEPGTCVNFDIARDSDVSAEVLHIPQFLYRNLYANFKSHLFIRRKRHKIVR